MHYGYNNYYTAERCFVRTCRCHGAVRAFCVTVVNRVVMVSFFFFVSFLFFFFFLFFVLFFFVFNRLVLFLCF